MPTAPASERSRRNATSWGASPFVLNRIRKIAATILFGAALSCASCKRSATERPAEMAAKNEAPSPQPQLSISPKRDDAKKPHGTEGYAVWYDVPANSLARRRAGKGEYTAAHNHLRLGTMVRVTNLANGKSVIVRITDRGITDKRFMIDLCKEAAAELGMLSEGMARVRIEELPDDKRVGVEPAPNSKASAAHP